MYRLPVAITALNQGKLFRIYRYEFSGIFYIKKKTEKSLPSNGESIYIYQVYENLVPGTICSISVPQGMRAELAGSSAVCDPDSCRDVYVCSGQICCHRGPRFGPFTKTSV